MILVRQRRSTHQAKSATRRCVLTRLLHLTKPLSHGRMAAPATAPCPPERQIICPPLFVTKSLTAKYKQSSLFFRTTRRLFDHPD